MCKIRVLQSKTIVARKTHKCNFCKGKIFRGEWYYNTSIANEGSVYTWKSHKECDKLSYDLGMYEDLWDEGLSFEQFMINVRKYLEKYMTYEEMEEYSNEQLVALATCYYEENS